ncbi:galactose-binding domain-like protein [Gaertneriomyces semiglobifer]|nr:galactose-binding domain-like protein [Gaertneriomyces semiglobifer]
MTAIPPRVYSGISSATSHHPSHPPQHALEPSPAKWWITTGLYPQELVLTLADPVKVSKIKLASTKVAKWVIEGCDAENFQDIKTNWKAVSEKTIDDVEGGLQQTTMDLSEPHRELRHLRLIIPKGYNAFASVHQITVYASEA